jgi:VWFA-related protein
VNLRTCLLIVSLSATTFAQTPAAPRSVRLDVVVTAKSAPPVTGLQQQDFTLLDNKSPEPITSFKAVTRQQPVKVIIMIDGVNTNFTRVSYVQQEVQKYLKSNEGRLAQPTSVGVLTDKGTQIQQQFSTDGNALSTALDHYTIGLREINRSGGFWGADERVQISLKSFQQLTAYAAGIPGRKVLIWISPGWPLLSGIRIDLDSKQHQQIFNQVVAFSKAVQDAQLTIYDINPIGPEENLARSTYYQTFLKGISKPNDTDAADLSLQVLAVQSGGQVLIGNSDVANSLQKCVADSQSWYELTFTPAAAEMPDEYHHIQVNLNKPGLIARTRDGYYAQP